MKLYGVTIISSDGDILVTKENGEKDWAESKTKVFLDKQDCIDYAVNEVKKAFENYEFEDGVDENGSDINMFTDDLLAGEDICIQGCSSHICIEYFVQELEIYPVVCHYSFDCDTPVVICATEEEAKQALRKDYEEERGIQIEENGHEEGCDLSAGISDDGTYAEILIDDGTGEDPYKIEWSIGKIWEG